MIIDIETIEKAFLYANNRGFPYYKYSDEEKMITSSYIKSVLIGLGNSDEELSKQLKKLARLAYNPKKISKTDLNEKKSKKPKPTKPDLWSRAKSLAKNKFDVYPSIYANAWAAKWYKSKESKPS